MQIGLALSGGSARGLAHIGALQAFEQIGLQIHQISACSSGGIIAALYAWGYAPKEISSFFTELNLLKIIKFDFSRLGILSIEKLRPLFEQYLKVDDFSALQIPLTVNATDIRTGKEIVFSEGELIRALQASACIPVVFKPIKLFDYLLVDGGILNNMPAQTLRNSCDFVIGINCNYYGNQTNFWNPKQILENVSRLMLLQNTEIQKQFCDFIIEPLEMSHFGVFDLKYASKIVEIGYKHTLKQADKLLAHLAETEKRHKKS